MQAKNHNQVFRKFLSICFLLSKLLAFLLGLICYRVLRSLGKDGTGYEGINQNFKLVLSIHVPKNFIFYIRTKTDGGKIALERLVGALIYYSLLQSWGKTEIAMGGLQMTSLEVYYIPLIITTNKILREKEQHVYNNCFNRFSAVTFVSTQ